MRMEKYFIFFRKELPLVPCADIAHYVLDVQCANAALGLGYKTVMVYCGESSQPVRAVNYISPFHLGKAGKEFQDFYGADKSLNMVCIPSKNAFFLTKYYFPFHIAPRARLIHTQHFLIAEAAVRCKVPVVYEQHYLQKHSFKKEVVQNPFFKLAVCQSEITKQSMIGHGMPPGKVVWMHNGFSPVFLTRQLDKAREWRNKLLKEEEKYLAVYSGTLHSFKGIDIIIESAKKLPEIKFVLTGGSEKQLAHYRELVKEVRNIVFLGWITPRKELVSIFQAADIMLHPHSLRHGNYTSTIKFLQYLASGTPIAATDLPFLADFKNKSLALCVCQPDNTEEFIGCIKGVLERFPRKSEGYRENIDFAKDFTWEKRTKRIFERIGIEPRT